MSPDLACRVDDRLDGRLAERGLDLVDRPRPAKNHDGRSDHQNGTDHSEQKVPPAPGELSREGDTMRGGARFRPRTSSRRERQRHYRGGSEPRDGPEDPHSQQAQYDDDSQWPVANSHEEKLRRVATPARGCSVVVGGGPSNAFCQSNCLNPLGAASSLGCDCPPSPSTTRFRRPGGPIAMFAPRPNRALATASEQVAGCPCYPRRSSLDQHACDRTDQGTRSRVPKPPNDGSSTPGQGWGPIFRRWPSAR
jgi:hypothetical protein